MRFLIDAQLPRRLAVRLVALGHEAIHTLDLPAGNRTSDRELCRQADATEAAIVTKDADFVINRTLTGSPRRLLVIATGNISNPALFRLVEHNLDIIQDALRRTAHLELTAATLIIRE